MLIRSDDVEQPIHIDFVPMADVLFNLLVFFLLATSLYQVEREMKVALPVAAASGPLTTAVREMVINVDAGGRIVVAGRELSEPDLGAMLRAAVAANAEQKVTVRGDRTTAYANVAKVLDLCKAAGVRQPFLQTIPAR